MKFCPTCKMEKEKYENFKTNENKVETNWQTLYANKLWTHYHFLYLLAIKDSLEARLRIHGSYFLFLY